MYVSMYVVGRRAAKACDILHTREYHVLKIHARVTYCARCCLVGWVRRVFKGMEIAVMYRFWWS